MRVSSLCPKEPSLKSVMTKGVGASLGNIGISLLSSSQTAALSLAILRVLGHTEENGPELTWLSPFALQQRRRSREPSPLFAFL